MKRNIWKKEWDILNREQEKYIVKHSQEDTKKLAKLQKYVPTGLQNQLDTAFIKAFQLIFEKGTGIIEKTYNKQKQQDTYEISEFSVSLRENRKHVRAFRREAGKHTRKNLMISTAEGVGLGLLGVGLPDIPLFVSMILKNLYQISLSFGYEYDSMEQRLFQLKIIETALYSGEQMRQRDDDINTMCWSIRGAKEKNQQQGEQLTETLDIQMHKTAKALADTMLYAKFLQGIPIVGVVGGVTDVTVLKRITDYAMLKYRRRYLLDREYHNNIQREKEC